MKVNIAVLNYNGKDLLEECLPSVIEASKNSSYPCRVTVLDNCSTDSSVDFVKNQFPGVSIWLARENKVYCSYNDFFRDASEEIILILNSDIKVDKDFLDPLIENFKGDQSVFFVSSRVYFFDGTTYQGDRAKAYNHFGIISAVCRYPGHERFIEQKGHTFSTGNGAFDRKKFIELGGFDTVYLPGRYEDVDLCFRGWKSGYKGIYEPRSIIFHKGYGTFNNTFSYKQIHSMVFRNSLLFMWKNISDWPLLFQFYFWLLPRLFFFLISGKLYLVSAFFDALKLLPMVLKKKKLSSVGLKLSDRDVFALWADL